MFNILKTEKNHVKGTFKKPKKIKYKFLKSETFGNHIPFK